jgi:hypothetical protein
MDREEAIAEQVEAMGLVNMSRHFYQCTGIQLRGTWTWQMRREGRWISSQCDYFFGRETNRQRFRRISVWMPCYYSDHHALVTAIHAGGGEELKRYHQRMQRFPITLPRGPQKQLNAEYEELQRDVVRPPLRERPANSWITAKMWKLVNHRAMLRRKGMLSQTTACGLGRQLKSRLAADRLKHAKNTALTIKGCLAAGDFVEAWRNLKGWYRSVEDRAPKACPETLALQTAERVELYTAVPPRGGQCPST